MPARYLVVITGNVGHCSAAARMAQDLAQHIVMVFVPVPRLAQPPAIKDIADKEQMLATRATKEVRQEIAARTPRPEMGVRDENAAIERSSTRNDGSVHVVRDLLEFSCG